MTDRSKSPNESNRRGSQVLGLWGGAVMEAAAVVGSEVVNDVLATSDDEVVGLRGIFLRYLHVY